MFTANLPVSLTAVSNSSERFKQHRTLGGSAVNDVTAVAVTPNGPSGPMPEMMLTPPASRRIANLKSSPLIVRSSSSAAVACIYHLTVSAGFAECVDLQRIWWHQRLSAVYTGQW